MLQHFLFLSQLRDLVLVDVHDYSVDLSENLGVVTHAPRVLTAENVFDVVLELFSADGANHMVCSWLGLFDALGVFLILVLFALHVLYVLVIFLVQKLNVYLRKLPLFLQLKNRRSVRSFQVESRDVIFADKNCWTKRGFHLLLLLGSVLLEVMHFMRVSFLRS